MSNISRRDFLKTAGVMTLAVAAAGVLAGCDGKTPEVPEVTATSVTVDNFTMTLKDVKQFAVKTYDKNSSGSNATNELENEERYVIALFNLKMVDESKAPEKAAELFTLTGKPVNMTKESLKETGKTNLSQENVKVLFGLDKDANVEILKCEESNSINSYVLTDTKKGEGKNYLVAYKVSKTNYAGDAYEFKAPALSFIANDSKGYVYTKLDATIPAAVDVESKKLYN